MTATSIRLSVQKFETLFPFRHNHLDPSASWSYSDGIGCLFETFSDELHFVRRQDPRTVWTLVDDDDGRPLVISGFHLVNRIGYLVSTVPLPDGADYFVRMEPEPGDEDAQFEE